MPMHIGDTELLNLIVGDLGRDRLDQLLFRTGQHASEVDHEEITDQVGVDILRFPVQLLLLRCAQSRPFLDSQ